MFFFLGRRPRGAISGGGGVNEAIGLTTASALSPSSITSTEHCCDSPKRKEQRTATPTKNYILRTVLTRDPEARKHNTMNLRGKAKISSYFQTNSLPKEFVMQSQSQLMSNVVEQNEQHKEIIDLTDDTTCDIPTLNCNSFNNLPLNFLGVINTSDNIFLQEPVLSLNIDKSPSQASSIIIKKSFDACQNFGASITVHRTSSGASSSDFTVSENGGMGISSAPLDLSKPTQVTQIDSTTFLNSDSNSGDSGVVIEKPADIDKSDKKPVTPHRILWVSPKKNLIENNATEFSQRMLYFDNKSVKSKKK